jgi:hypothetical protein
LELVDWRDWKRDDEAIWVNDHLCGSCGFGAVDACAVSVDAEHIVDGRVGGVSIPAKIYSYRSSLVELCRSDDIAALRKIFPEYNHRCICLRRGAVVVLFHGRLCICATQVSVAEQDFFFLPRYD